MAFTGMALCSHESQTAPRGACCEPGTRERRTGVQPRGVRGMEVLQTPDVGVQGHRFPAHACSPTAPVTPPHARTTFVTRTHTEQRRRQTQNQITLSHTQAVRTPTTATQVPGLTHAPNGQRRRAPLMGGAPSGRRWGAPAQPLPAPRRWLWPRPPRSGCGPLSPAHRSRVTWDGA